MENKISLTTIVLATRNQDKVSEIRDILNPFGWHLVSLNELDIVGEVVEDGITFEENALKKARFAFQKTGMPSLADDSGLEVDFLEGRPGVFSSRYAGENATSRENNLKLLSELDGVAEENRQARFRCVVAFVNGSIKRITEGACEGLIHTEFHGDGGFGYDPLFFVPSLGKTFSEITSAEKNRISHRGLAFRRMTEKLQDLK
ncbi:hypothetical protein BVY01_01365 [bacterium I07]|nr:hypothetical protein BVY01_01365 [bacterium I07]